MSSAVVLPRAGQIAGTLASILRVQPTPSARTMGSLVVTSFCLVIAGPNLPTALLPAYRDAYRMSPFGLSLVFATYLLLLVPALLVCTRPSVRARAGRLLTAGLLAAVAAD